MDNSNDKNYSFETKSEYKKSKKDKVFSILMITFSFITLVFFAITTSVTYAAYVQSVKNSYKYNSITKLISSSLGGGNGTLGDPYKISTADHLKSLSNLMVLDLFNEKTVFILTNDINWDRNTDGVLFPIGNNDYPFVSTFDGRGKVISNLIVYGTNTSDIGMFGYCGEQSVVKNILLQYPRVVVKSNTIPNSRSGKDKVNANPLDDKYGDFARGLYNPDGPVTLYGDVHPSNTSYTKWVKKEGGKNEDKVQFYNCYLKLPKTAYANDNSESTPIKWSVSNPAIAKIEYISGHPFVVTNPMAGGNPSSTRISFFVSGDIYKRERNTFIKYNLERYQINIIGTGAINEDVLVLETGEEVTVGVIKTIHNPIMIRNCPISVGLFIGRTDGRASHLGMIGGKKTSYSSINQEKGIIQIQGRGAYTSSTLIGRTRITDNLDTVSGGDELKITYDMSSLDPEDADYTQRDKVASCWPDPYNVPITVDANGEVYCSLQQYHEQKQRALALTQLYLDPTYTLVYKDEGFINYPLNKGGDTGEQGDFGYNLKRLAGDTIDYHHYDYNEFENRPDGFLDGTRYNSMIYPQCKLVDVRNLNLIDVHGQEVDDKFAVKLNGGLGASTYTWFTSVPDNFNGDIGAVYNEDDWNLYQVRWDGWKPGWPHSNNYKHYSDQYRYRSWQLYGHAPDTMCHNDGSLYALSGGNDPEHGYWWTHVARDFAITNGFWLWATKDKTPVVYEGNKYDVTLKIRYFANNTTTPGIPTNKYNFKLLYNHYNPDVVSYMRVTGTLYYYYYHLSYLQNLIWYELNNPYNDEYKNIGGPAHPTNGKVIVDDLNQNLYNPKDHMIIDDGLVHYDKIRFSYEKQNNRGAQEFVWLGDRCEWFPCFAFGMGKSTEEGDPTSNYYNDGGPAMGAYYNILGSYEHVDEDGTEYGKQKRINKTPTQAKLPFTDGQGRNAIWNDQYLFYNGSRFQSWDRKGSGQDGMVSNPTTSHGDENKSLENDEGFFNTQYTTDDDISLYVLKLEAVITSKAGNVGDLIHHVDFITGVTSVTFDDQEDAFTTWSDPLSEAKPKFDIPFDEDKKDMLISYAFGRTGSTGKVFGYYTDATYPIYYKDTDISDDVGQAYWYSGQYNINKY